MNLPAEQKPPRYVTCCCQHCDGHIEFDAHQLTENNSNFPCPHCGLETKLFVPQTVTAPAGADPPVFKREGFSCGDPIFEAKPPLPAEASVIPPQSLTEEQINSIGERQNDAMAAKLYAEGDQDMSLKIDDARRYVRDPRFKVMNPETGERFTPETLEIYIRSKQRSLSERREELSQARIDYLISVGVPDADKLDDPNHPWNHQSASPKQVAYLTYMGVDNAARLTKKEAYDLIESNRFLDGAESLAAIERIQVKQSRWHEERLKLYPELYASDLKYFLSVDLPNSLHGYVRRRMVGASETLSKAKIRRVVEILTGENSRWWHNSNRPEIFFDRLRQIYPGCCDGRTPEQI
jgi:hypothetical protein